MQYIVIFYKNLIFDDNINIIIEHLILYLGISLILLKYNGINFSISVKKSLLILFNQCIVGYSLLKCFKIIPVISNNTLYTELINYTILYHYLQCIWYYFAHRILYQRFFWKHIYYINNYKMPYAKVYCHPLYYLFLNLMSVFIGPILFPSNMLVTKLWFHICTTNTVISHFSRLRGYKPEIHDLQYLFYRYNYGTDCFMDIIFGTYMKP